MTIRAHELALARRFYEGVKDVDGVTCLRRFFGPGSARRSCRLNIRRRANRRMVADALAEDL